MKTVFKRGDKVFDIRYGWGKVIGIAQNPNFVYPVLVLFNGFEATYTLDGAPLHGELRLLSFTEYEFVGFSQKRPSLFAQAVGKVKEVINKSLPKK